jgi:hypothetical protein
MLTATKANHPKKQLFFLHLTASHDQETVSA